MEPVLHEDVGVARYHLARENYAAGAASLIRLPSKLPLATPVTTSKLAVRKDLCITSNGGFVSVSVYRYLRHYSLVAALAVLHQQHCLRPRLPLRHCQIRLVLPRRQSPGLGGCVDVDLNGGLTWDGVTAGICELRRLEAEEGVAGLESQSSLSQQMCINAWQAACVVT